LEACDALAAAADRGLRGHFVFQDIGCGKTFTLLLFLARLRDRGAAPPCCVWAAPRETLQSLATEIGRFAPVALFEGAVRPGVVLLVELLHGLRRPGTREALLRAAPATLFVVDEVHRAYNPTLRTSVALEVAAEAARVVAMTGTPAIDARMEKLARWLALCADYEVSARNWLVAAAEMIAHHLELGIEVRREDLWVDWPAGPPAAYLAALADQKWGAAAAAAWDAADPALAREAVRLAGERGALLVARDEAHRRRLRALTDGLGAKSCLVEADDGRARLVLAVKHQCHGFNHLVRLGALVSGPYPSNAAERAQMLGRLRRLGQTAKSVVSRRVAVRGSLVQLLAERHDIGGAANLTIEALARLLSPDELRGLRPSSSGSPILSTEPGAVIAEGRAGPEPVVAVADDDPVWATIGW
ncbi:MAG TPA: DEAD/DEAH box helicase family protein, partial [Elusimicrobiota bacterium]|nr:DEAD/DEAH box helicase family protein [Elusimicrobiota bacterium]